MSTQVQTMREESLLEETIGSGGELKSLSIEKDAHLDYISREAPEIPSIIMDGPYKPRVQHAYTIPMNGRYPVDPRDHHHSIHSEDALSMARLHSSKSKIELPGLFSLGRHVDTPSKISISAKSQTPKQRMQNNRNEPVTSRPVSVQKGLVRNSNQHHMAQPFQKRSPMDLHWTSEHRRLLQKHETITRSFTQPSPAASQHERLQTTLGQDPATLLNTEHKQIETLGEKAKSAFVHAFEDLEEFKRANYDAKKSRLRFEHVVKELEGLTTTRVPAAPFLPIQETPTPKTFNDFTDIEGTTPLSVTIDEQVVGAVMAVLNEVIDEVLGSIIVVEEQTPVPKILISSSETDSMTQGTPPVDIDHPQNLTALPSTEAQLTEDHERLKMIGNNDFWKEADALLKQSHELAQDLGIKVPSLVDLLPMTSAFYGNWFFDDVEFELIGFELEDSTIKGSTSENASSTELHERNANQIPTIVDEMASSVVDTHHGHYTNTNSDSQTGSLARHERLQHVFAHSLLPSALPLTMNINDLARQMLDGARREEKDAGLVEGMLWIMDVLLVCEREDELRHARMERMGWA